MYVNGVKIYLFKVKDSQKNTHPLCLGNISKEFTNDNMKKRGLNWCLYDFLVGFKVTDKSEILNIHKYFMAKHDTKMLTFIKQVFNVLMSLSGSFARKCISVDNESCIGNYHSFTKHLFPTKKDVNIKVNEMKSGA